MAGKILEKLDVLDEQAKILLARRAKVCKIKAKTQLNHYKVTVPNVNDYFYFLANDAFI